MKKIKNNFKILIHKEYQIQAIKQSVACVLNSVQDNRFIDETNCDLWLHLKIKKKVTIRYESGYKKSQQSATIDVANKSYSYDHKKKCDYSFWRL